MGDTESVLGWARPWAIMKPFPVPSSPRAGAWYPVVGKADNNRVVLEIRGKRVAVKRHLVELRDRRPDKFTVVTLPKAGASAQETGSLGHRYAVCPSCNARVPLWGEPQKITCGTCHHSGVVAYWETG